MTQHRNKVGFFALSLMSFAVMDLSFANPQDVLRGWRYAPVRQQRAGGKTYHQSIDPRMHEAVARYFRTYPVAGASLVMMDAKTGRILTMIEHGKPGWSTQVDAPSASVFKMVTAYALLEVGVSPETRTCVHGGSQRIDETHLRDQSYDQDCYNLFDAFANSTNAVFAKLAHRHLNAAQIQRAAERFGYGKDFSFELQVDRSMFDVPGAPLERARMAAGFHHAKISPVHGALLGAVVANGGVAYAPTLVDEIWQDGAQSTRLYARSQTPVLRIAADKAEVIKRMMARTVTHGTARHSFYVGSRARFPRLKVYGKTGTLSTRNPFRGFNWFVGFAERGESKVAFAALTEHQGGPRLSASDVVAVALESWNQTPAARD